MRSGHHLLKPTPSARSLRNASLTHLPHTNAGTIPSPFKSREGLFPAWKRSTPCILLCAGAGASVGAGFCYTMRRENFSAQRRKLQSWEVDNILLMLTASTSKIYSFTIDVCGNWRTNCEKVLCSRTGLVGDWICRIGKLSLRIERCWRDDPRLRLICLLAFPIYDFVIRRHRPELLDDWKSAIFITISTGQEKKKSSGSRPRT